TGDPWDARTLEWSVASPAPAYNFAVIPEVQARDAFWDMKQRGVVKPPYEAIHMPRNTAAGIYISIFAFLLGFGFVWHIVWLPVVAIVGIIICLVTRTFNEDTEYTIPAATVEKMAQAQTEKLQRLPIGNPDPAEDMGLMTFVRTVLGWAWGLVRGRR